MGDRKVKLKNREGDYLLPYTDNIPIDTTATVNSQKPITSGAVYTALNNLTTAQHTIKSELTTAIATAKAEAVLEAKFKYTVATTLPDNPDADTFYFITG